MKKAVFYTAVGKYTTIIMQTLFSMILSRLLTPTEFGTVAVISIFIAFFSILSDLGLGAGVIQNRGLTRQDINHIFSVSIYLGIGLMVLFIFLSYPIVLIYKDAIYYKLCPILAIAVLFNSFNMIPNSVMLKEKRFLSIAKRSFVSCIASYMVSIYLAFQGWGVYALCLSQVISSMIIFLWNQLSVKLRFFIKPNLAAVKSIWNYSFYQFISQTINYFCRSLDNFLIGIMFPKAQLAYYNKSYSLMMMPISHIPGVVNPVLHPILSEHQDNKEIIYNKYLKVIKLLSAIGCIVSSVCFLFGKYIILFMFGNQWEEAVLPFRILSLSILPQLLTHTIGAIYQSAGETKLLFKSVMISTILILSCIIIGALLGSIVSVAYFVSIAYIINFFITFYLLIEKVFHNPFNMFLRNLLPELLFVATIISANIIINECMYSTITQVILLCAVTSVYLLTGNRANSLIKMLK